MSTSDSAHSLDGVFRSYAMEYFKIHADQRLRAFYFFLLLETAVLAGFATLLKDGSWPKWAALFGLLGALFAFVFWKLDERTKFLVRIAEESLKALDSRWTLADESNGGPSVSALFSREEYLTNSRPVSDMSAPVKLSYSRCFNIMFIAFGTIYGFIALGVLVTGR